MAEKSVHDAFLSKSQSYGGAVPTLSMDATLSLGPPNNCSTTPSIRLYLAKYHAYPCTMYCMASGYSSNLHVTTILDYICKELKHDPKHDIVTRINHRRNKFNYTCSRLSDLGNGIMFDFSDISLDSDLQNPNNYTPDKPDDYFLITSQISIYYLPECEEFVHQLSEKFSQMTLLSSKSCILQMVCRNQNGYYLNGINIKRPLISDLALHYGNKFVSIHDRIIKNLNKKEGKGIVLLHGVPGSGIYFFFLIFLRCLLFFLVYLGKTHYIRYLIHEIEDKTLIYVPPDMAKEISSPEFLPFLMQYQESILIIEDAENIIKDRNESLIPSQAVANLLNLCVLENSCQSLIINRCFFSQFRSDGLLGDAMHQQIIATFNCDLTTIDPALLRKGRLIANYEFNKLDIESSKILSDKLGYGTEQIIEPMTLAEIYNQNEKSDEENEDKTSSS